MFNHFMKVMSNKSTKEQKNPLITRIKVGFVYVFEQDKTLKWCGDGNLSNTY